MSVFWNTFCYFSVFLLIDEWDDSGCPKDQGINNVLRYSETTYVLRTIITHVSF